MNWSYTWHSTVGCPKGNGIPCALPSWACRERPDSWSEASAGSIGSWSAEKYLPMAMWKHTHGRDLVLQIEHNGSWYWRYPIIRSGAITRMTFMRTLRAGRFAFRCLEESEAWGELSDSPGCCWMRTGRIRRSRGALTRYRRVACERPHKDNAGAPSSSTIT